MNDYLRETIQKSHTKMITYADFIKAALYHPEKGYYMTDLTKIGPRGDFITTSNFSDIFGKIIAKWYAGIHGKLDLPPSVCEVGAGNGRFAKAFTEGWNQYSKKPLAYSLVETSPYHRKLQAETLYHSPGVTQYSDLEEVPCFEGLIFSNELFDALPVHVIERKEGKLFEAMVTFKEGRFAEALIPLENNEIHAFIRRQGIELINGQRLEIPLEMEKVVNKISGALSRGIAITVDYGYTYEEWKNPARRRGSLRGYYQQQMVEDVLKHPGSMDITSHIHFDALIQQGEASGLKLVSMLRQDEFLMKLGLLEELEDNYDTNPFSEKSRRNRAIRSLILPDGMSSSFHVILQGKGIGSEAILE